MIKPLISVLIPVYNVEKYLRACLDSIVGQTYGQLEIILIDDGSKDSSGTICDEYAATDKRIRVVHQHNGGVSAARNRALSEALGDYICWVDADDECAPDMIESLVHAALDCNADLAVCRYTMNEAEYRDVTDKKRESVVPLVLDDTAKIRALILDNTIPPSMWAKLTRRSLYDGLSFPPIRVAEDVFVMYSLGERIKTAAIIMEVKYFYRRNFSSLTKTTDIESSLTSFNKIKAHIEPGGSNRDRYIYLHLVYTMAHDIGQAANREITSYRKNRDDVENLFKYLKANRREIADSPTVGRLGRLEMAMLYSRLPGRFWFSAASQKFFEFNAKRKERRIR